MFGPGIDAILAIRKKKGPRGGRSEVQSIRFKADKFTAAEAKRWLREYDYKPILFESVSKKNPQALAVLNTEEVQSAKRLRADFMNDGRTEGDVELIPVELPDLEGVVLVVIGEYLRIDYGSDKFGDGPQHYYHESSLGGTVAIHPEGKCILILPPEGEVFEVDSQGLLN